MSTLRVFMISTLLLLPAGALAQQPSPIVTDRPGFLFSSLTVGRGVFQTEWGILAVTLDSGGGVDTRFTSLFGLVRYGVTRNFELRLDSPVYNQARLAGASDSSFLGGGIKYLVSNDFQLDLSFDRGLTADSPDWLFGFGIAARF